MDAVVYFQNQIYIMFRSFSSLHFDTTCIVLCLIAGATSQPTQVTEKATIDQPYNFYRTSFIDTILDTGIVELVQSSNTINMDLAIHYSPQSVHISSTPTIAHQQSSTICAQLSNLLSGSKMKFCLKHLDVLEIILPHIVQLTKKECTRITRDLKWNCSAIDLLLDRSSPLAFTKEAALVRSILNASMMYLVAKTCNDDSRKSCGCQNSQQYATSVLPSKRNMRRIDNDAVLLGDDQEDINSVLDLVIDQQILSPSDLSRLDAGSPLRLTKPIKQRQGCIANTAFANTFTKVFIDSDDSRALSKAYKILNEDLNHSRSSHVKRIIDSDSKDLAYIKWTKSAINLHNNNVGRQIVLKATERRCRCHGLSGVCQFQTCWDQLLDFGVITSRLRSIYLNETSRVEVTNLGSYDRPDLSLVRSGQSSLNKNSTLPTKNRLKPEELFYLYESPEYCDPQPKLRHPGTKGRACISTGNVTNPGSCDQLCCNRGYYGELVLEMVPCHCKFKFCCKVDCEPCLRQRIQHFCR